MPRALLIADLEGVAAVTSLGALLYGEADYPAACAAMTAEVNAAVEGLLAAGFDEVRVSDSHRSGSGRPNLGALHPAAELRYVDEMYGGPLLDGVGVVAAVGMHAAGGSRGFAAHTVELHTAWRWGGALISEAELAFALAAERGVPAVFCAGDDVLRRSLPGTAYVSTKRSAGVQACRPVATAQVLRALRAAASARPALRKLPARRRLTLHFKREAHADAAAAAGGQRVSPFAVGLPAGRFTDSYHRALELIAKTSPLLANDLVLPVGTSAFSASAVRLLAEPFPAASRGRRASPAR